MVRWVFRPYTQIRRAICTLASRRTSTRVSPGFILPKYSSPSFGSSSIYSNFRFPDSHTLQLPAACAISFGTKSIMRRAFHVSTLIQLFSLSFRIRAFIFTLILAYKWDSLVRVSRRVNLIYSYWGLHSLSSNNKIAWCQTVLILRSRKATRVNHNKRLEDQYSEKFRT